MVGKGKKKGLFRFAVKPRDGGREVLLAGDFSEWKPVKMTKQKDGTFVSSVPLAPGSHEYKFIIDGQWITDPDHGTFAVGPHGPNSVFIAE